jgi:hypothetical protein
MMRLPLPICAVCERPVEKMTRWYDVCRMQTVYVAECHGESERSVLTDHDLFSAHSIEVGYAFTLKTLESDHGRLPPRLDA